MSRAHASLERVRDRFDAGAQKALNRDRPRPRTDTERELVTEVDATIARWIAQAGPAEVAAILGARIGKLLPASPAARPRQQGFEDRLIGVHSGSDVDHGDADPCRR